MAAAEQQAATATAERSDLRSQAVTEKLEDPTQLTKTRKEIARIKTLVRERELAQTSKK